MKLKNRETGKIVELTVHHIAGKCYESLADINEDWEDVPEEPKEDWYINEYGSAMKAENYGRDTLYDKSRNNFGNKFSSREEAELVVRKLEAWKRLKDKGFKFERWQTWEKVTGLACFDRGVVHSYYASFTFRSEDRLEKDEQVKADLDLLFSEVKND